MFEAASTAAGQIFTLQAMTALIAGVIIGVLSGALPGGAVPTLVVLLGFAYGMDPFIALPLAIGMVSTVPPATRCPPCSWACPVPRRARRRSSTEIRWRSKGGRV